MKKFIFTICLFLTLSAGGATPVKLQSVKPETVGMNPEQLAVADQVIEKAIAGKVIPGAVLAVLRSDKIVYLKAYGNRALVPSVEPMTTDTMFDLASVSKCVGTTIAIMQLVEQGKIRISDKVSYYVPGFAPWVDPYTGEKVDITIEHLLTHSSGIADYVKRPVLLKDYEQPYDQCLKTRITKEIERKFRPGTGYKYSCLNFVSLQYIIEAVTGERFCDYVQKNVFDVLGLQHTCYCPDEKMFGIIAPTVQYPNGDVLRGQTQDPLARLLNGGNSGNAGVFSNAEDLAVICAALQNGGAIAGRRILSPASVRKMATIPAGIDPCVGRALGWDTFSRPSVNIGDLFPPATIFHTGYTGTEVLLDLESGVSMILLTNRCHPKDKGTVGPLRGKVSNVVAASIER